MDGRSRSFCSSSSSCHSGGRTCYQANQDRISFLLGQSLPSCYPSSAGAGYEFGGVGSSGTAHCSLLHSRRRSPDPDLDSLDCEIEDGREVSEEPATLAPARSSSSKRNRAAEVHNLSEKRRRSKINEKMKALQSLIPNSSKTDKASMLDEAIEYLKQLQLQVQMLSIRNSLSQHPMYLSGALQPLQALQMGIDVGLAADKAMNLGVGMLPLNQGSSVVNSFDLSSLHQFASIPSVINITTPGTSFAMEPSHPHHGSILLPMTIEEILTREMITCQQPNARHSPRRLTGKSAKAPQALLWCLLVQFCYHFMHLISILLEENEVTSMAAATSQHSRGQASLVGADHAEECMLGRVSSQDVLSKLPEKETFIQSLCQ